MTTAFVICVIVLISLYLFKIYRKLIFLLTEYKNAFAAIERELKCRYDLIPSLIELAKSYLSQESQTLQTVVKSRNSAMAHLKKAQSNPENITSMAALNQAEDSLSAAMGGFYLVIEDYPELKANKTMIKLYEELMTAESSISLRKKTYNDLVQTYNAYRELFPNALVANNTGHSEDMIFLEFSDSQSIKEALKIS